MGQRLCGDSAEVARNEKQLTRAKGSFFGKNDCAPFCALPTSQTIANGSKRAGTGITSTEAVVQHHSQPLQPISGGLLTTDKGEVGGSIEMQHYVESRKDPRPRKSCCFSKPI
jgi:hypothetical protein